MSMPVIIAIAVAVIVALLLVFLPGRRGGATRIAPRDEAPYVASTERPYVKAAPPPAEGEGVAGELAAAATDVSGEVLGVDAHRALSGKDGPADDLQRLKGVGPKFVARLNELGITRYDQLAGLNATELAHLDERMGPFRGRLARDRIAEQADYLARGDTDGFEERFGKLGG
jgi:predicted flap endonuclease-1-like 5' DNA nuclease